MIYPLVLNRSYIRYYIALPILPILPIPRSSYLSFKKFSLCICSCPLLISAAHLLFELNVGVLQQRTELLKSFRSITWETTYSNKKFDIIDPNKWLIQYLFLKCHVIYQIFNIISYLTNIISCLTNIIS